MSRTTLTRLASVLPKGSGERRTLLRMAMEFPTPEALKEYLKEHPGADEAKHTVKKDEGKSKEKDESQSSGGGGSFAPLAQKAVKDLKKEMKRLTGGGYGADFGILRKQR